MLNVTPLYAGLLALIFLWLSANVVRGRYLHRVSVGDGGEKDMVKRMRAQANFSEYAPLGLILLAMAELQGLNPTLLHLCGASLLLGRASHAYGFGHTPQIVALRKLGMYLTVASILAGAVINIWLSLT